MDVLKKDIFSKLRKLECYAREGKWQNVLEFAGHFKAAAAAAAAQDSVAKQAIIVNSSAELQDMLQEEFDAELAFTTFKVQALMRLKKFAAAADELATLGDLPERQLAGSCRSCMPFGLLYLRAQLPACLEEAQTTVDLLHELQSHCQQQLQHALQLQQQQQISKPDQVQRWAQQQMPGPDVQHRDQAQQQLGLQQQSISAGAVTLWQHRLQGVTCSLISHYWLQGSVTPAFQLLDQLLLQSPDSIRLWSLAGRLQLQMNLMPQAHRSFSKVQQLVQQQQQQREKQQQQQREKQQQQQQQQLVSLEQQQVVHHNWGCYHAMAGNLTGALADFHAAQELAATLAEAAAIGTSATAAAAVDPLRAAAPAGDVSMDDTDDLDPAAAAAGTLKGIDGVAVSNYAVCLLHMGQLTEAISALEAAVLQHPAMLTQGCAAYNLGLMYDLAYRDATAKQARHQIATAALRVMPDDFDLSCVEQSS